MTKASSLSKRNILNWIQEHQELILLGCLTLIGWFVRVILAVNTGGQVHPDEIYQSLEIAHKLKYGGHAFIAWEFQIPSSPEQDGAARSYLFPLLFLIIFEGCELLGIPYGIDGTLRVVRIFSATWSTLLIPIVFYLSKELFPAQNKPYIFSLFAAFLTTVWFPFLFFGIRTLTNSFVAIPIFLAIYLHLLTSKKINEFSSPKAVVLEFTTGVLLGFACALRLDSFVFFVPFFLLHHQNNRQTVYFYILIFLGFAVSFFIQGQSDLVYYGTFLISPINWMKFNIIEGKSSNFGTESFYYYIVRIILQPFYTAFFGILFGILIIKINAAYRYKRKIEDPWFFIILQLLFWFLISLGIISLVGHKEDRFIFSLYPVIMIIFGATMRECFKVLEGIYHNLHPTLLPKFIIKLVIRQKSLRISQMKFFFITCVLVILTSAITSIFVDWAHYHDVNKGLEWVGRQETSTGVIVLAHWRDIGGWTHLHKNISMFYFEDDPKHNQMWTHLPPSFNYLVTRQDNYYEQKDLREQINKNFTLVKTIDNRVDIWFLRELNATKERKENTNMFSDLDQNTGNLLMKKRVCYIQF
ncbi:MAG: hypothetical protein ACFFC7_02195 [Candidatus Hermodarchaeota archaeon]